MKTFLKLLFVASWFFLAWREYKLELKPESIRIYNFITHKDSIIKIKPIHDSIPEIVLDTIKNVDTCKIIK